MVVNNNDVRENDDNIALFDADGVTVHQNAARNSTEFDGLFADEDSTGNQFTENFADDNQAFDCEDSRPRSAYLLSPTPGRTTPAPRPSRQLLCTPPFGGSTQTQGPQAARTQAVGHAVQPAG